MIATVFDRAYRPQGCVPASPNDDAPPWRDAFAGLCTIRIIQQSAENSPPTKLFGEGDIAGVRYEARETGVGDWNRFDLERPYAMGSPIAFAIFENNGTSSSGPNFASVKAYAGRRREVRDPNYIGSDAGARGRKRRAGKAP